VKPPLISLSAAALTLYTRLRVHALRSLFHRSAAAGVVSTGPSNVPCALFTQSTVTGKTTFCHPHPPPGRVSQLILTLRY
jgi:hypothetical protein